MIKFICKRVYLIFLFLFFSNILLAENNFFLEGKRLFDLKKYKDSKLEFERDIVFNPKNEKSYLYLAKIFKQEKKTDLEENNLNTVILINPKNEEAIYLLTLLSIKKSNFDKAKDLIDTFDNICVKSCLLKEELLRELETSSKQ
tara:strand:- start:1317 stop:1748 length:432 start_codon:yes stop_codon:yes gene_type:complete